MAKRYITPKKLAEYMQIALESSDYVEGRFFLHHQDFSQYDESKYQGCVLVAASYGRAVKGHRLHKLRESINDMLKYETFLNIPHDINSLISRLHFTNRVSIPDIISRLQNMASWEQTQILDTF